MLRRAGSYTFADDGHRPLLAMAQTPSAYWSRPIHADVCSMFARMPWYALVRPGTIRHPQRGAGCG
jgi:hypothetical protein